jgi:hypothetical protein
MLDVPGHNVPPLMSPGHDRQPEAGALAHDHVILKPGLTVEPSHGQIFSFTGNV